MAKREPLIGKQRCVTALCLWEAFIDAEYAGVEANKFQTACGSHDPTHWTDGLRDEMGGSFEARERMIEIAEHADRVWEELPDDIRDHLAAFDFEFCPMFLEHAVDWEAYKRANQYHPLLVKFDATAQIVARVEIERKCNPNVV